MKHDVLYWKTRRYAFGYTPWADEQGKFYAIKYRLRDGAAVKKLAFARRKVARNRAYHWYQQAKMKEKPLAPPKPKPKPTSQQKLAVIQERIKTTETKIKRLSTHLKKLKRQEKYYQKKIAEGET